MLIYTMLVSWSQTNQQLLRQIAHTASSSFQARASWLQLLTVHDLVVPLWDPPPLSSTAQGHSSHGVRLKNWHRTPVIAARASP